jgi:hypothetical protein
MTDENRIVIAGTMIQILLVGIITAVVHPHLTRGALACVLLLLAAEVFIFREVWELRQIGVRERNERLGRLGGSSAPPLPKRPSMDYAAWANHSPAPDTGSTERRKNGIQLRPDDSVPQIARSMVTASFRQASLKYHPDHGGSTDLMVRIVQARDLLFSVLKR